MTICDHQFRGGDGSDWVLSTSVGCLDGSTTASQILQELFKKHSSKLKTETPKKRPKTTAYSPPKTHPDSKRHPPPPKNKPEDTLIVRKIPGISNFENFDESQHLNGCPMKWLYNKRLMEKNKTVRTERLCCMKSPRKEETKKERNRNLRDRTPVEVKIHKINLMEKYTTDSDLITAAEQKRELEIRRKKLAAKLNWKLHDDSQDGGLLETSSEAGSRHNYFPPRPLLGLKPLLSVLLTPHYPNCSCQQRDLPPTGKVRQPSLSIQSLDLPCPREEPKLRPKTTNGLRWGSKSYVHIKKLQVPNQITIRLEQKKQKSPPERKTNSKVTNYNPPVKRKGEGRNQTKSLSSLFYELKGKTSCRVIQNEEILQEVIRELAECRDPFLNFYDSGRGWRVTADRKEKSEDEDIVIADETNLICGKVRFFRKKLPKQNKPI